MFMRHSHFIPTFIVDKKLKKNHFEACLNPNLKEKMSVHQYIFYEDMYDTAVNVERAMKGKNEYYNEQRRSKRKED